ncbi:MAG TPA: peptidoglycan editing factor PgeF [Candidatus Latescibacteria bacterium]|nr:peptidoglycan editing factor PgeF [Candidatus Latescibacterota bacterium]
MFRLTSETGLPMLRSSLLDELPGVWHGFTTRIGGVSAGSFAFLNLSLNVGDSPDAVLQNRSLLARSAGISPEMVTLQAQQHGSDVVLCDSVSPEAARRADAFIATREAIPVLVGTADCLPVLLASEDGRIVASIHAGWKGVLAEVIPRTVTAMQTVSGARPESMRAAIGPHIRACCFEVGDDVAHQFRKEHVVAPRARGGKSCVDLSAAAVCQLEDSGIAAKNIDISSTCTVCRHDLFFSHRANGGTTGRTVAMIMRRR